MRAYQYRIKSRNPHLDINSALDFNLAISLGEEYPKELNPWNSREVLAESKAEAVRYIATKLKITQSKVKKVCEIRSREYRGKKNNGTWIAALRYTW